MSSATDGVSTRAVNGEAMEASPNRTMSVSLTADGALRIVAGGDVFSLVPFTIEMPTCACFKAPTSLVPSPHLQTTGAKNENNNCEK